MTLRGVRFTKGLGTNSPSEIEYYLGGTCSKLTTSVGVDDDAEGHGSVKFQIYVDDALVADSGLMTGTMPPKSLSADLSHADTLKLVVQDGGDNIEFDHGDWGRPDNRLCLTLPLLCRRRGPLSQRFRASAEPPAA